MLCKSPHNKLPTLAHLPFFVTILIQKFRCEMHLTYTHPWYLYLNDSVWDQVIFNSPDSNTILDEYLITIKYLHEIHIYWWWDIFLFCNQCKYIWPRKKWEKKLSSETLLCIHSVAINVLKTKLILSTEQGIVPDH